jgi:hypothetical protein
VGGSKTKKKEIDLWLSDSITAGVLLFFFSSLLFSSSQKRRLLFALARDQQRYRRCWRMKQEGTIKLREAEFPCLLKKKKKKAESKTAPATRN